MTTPPKQQKLPFPAVASVWLLATMAGINVALSEWSQRVEDRSMWPHTAILSNTVDLSTWKGCVTT